MSQKAERLTLDAAEWVAIHGLSFLAGDSNRLERFLTLTGMGPADMSAARTDVGILAAVLEYMLGDEPLLLAFAANNALPPEQIETAWDMLTLEAARRSRA
jgi:hypothetical protein